MSRPVRGLVGGRVNNPPPDPLEISLGGSPVPRRGSSARTTSTPGRGAPFGFCPPGLGPGALTRNGYRPRPPLQNITRRLAEAVQQNQRRHGLVPLRGAGLTQSTPLKRAVWKGFFLHVPQK